MPAVNFKTDKLISCLCGFKPEYYSVLYGPTPYTIFCPICIKQTQHYKRIGGCEQNIIDLWNNIVSRYSKQELNIMAKSEGFITALKKTITELYSRKLDYQLT